MKPLINLFLALIVYPLLSIGQVQNNGNFKLHTGASLAIQGDFTNNGTFSDNSGTIYVVGPNAQLFNGSNAIHTNNFTINKTSNSLHLDNVMQVGGILTFNNGSIESDRADDDAEFVEFLDGSSYVGESDTSHIDGVVRKTGNDAFVFPVGSGSLLRTITISAPSLATDHFTGYYSENDPDNNYDRTALDTGLDHVSSCEYWILNKTGGTSNPTVTLSWGTNSCGIDDLCGLQVTRWNGAEWTSEGNGGANGVADSGTIVSGVDCSVPGPVGSFSPFTLGSTNSNNSLPISLVNFDAKVCESSVCLNWQTASEINNDFFSIEKSTDGLRWEHVEDIDGAGNSQMVLDYKTIDPAPYSGVSYYRLKQTDYDGAFSYSTVVPVQLDQSLLNRLSLYPNPARERITIEGRQSELNALHIYNTMGQEVTSIISTISTNENSLQLNISQLKPGAYHVKTMQEYHTFIKQ
jgi:hypothetical protein